MPKPLDKERIFSGIKCAVEIYKKVTNVVAVSGSNIQRIYTNDLMYITIKKRKTILATTTDIIESDKSIDYWRELLPDKNFVQPHYSYIVNLEYINLIDKNDIIINHNDEKIKIKIAQKKVKAIKDRFYHYILENL